MYCFRLVNLYVVDLYFYTQLNLKSNSISKIIYFLQKTNSDICRNMLIDLVRSLSHLYLFSYMMLFMDGSRGVQVVQTPSPGKSRGYRLS